jgi:hypothetical protein
MDRRTLRGQLQRKQYSLFNQTVKVNKPSSIAIHQANLRRINYKLFCGLSLFLDPHPLS